MFFTSMTAQWVLANQARAIAPVNINAASSSNRILARPESTCLLKA
jgi:hypothetical protein